MSLTDGGERPWVGGAVNAACFARVTHAGQVAPRYRARSPWFALVITLAACGREVAFVDPRAATEPADSTGDTTVVTRGSLDVMVGIGAQDTAITRAIGWTGTAPAGATVTVRRTGQSSQEATTDSAGRVRFEGLVTGSWVVSAIRLLTTDERAALPAGAEDVTGFSGAVAVSVEEAGSAAAITALAGRTGTVVISEVFPAIERTAAGEDYTTGHFIELYNNGPETEYLDGMVVGLLYFLTVESRVATCEESAQWREDSLGVWVNEFASFPGSGTAYPLPPGRAVVVATDAIDHRPFAPSLPNLSGANFEFLGSSDVDNPAVPNMVNTGLREHRASVGHGILFGFTQILAFVAAPVDPGTLLRDFGAADEELVRIPRAAVLDVLTSRPTPERQAGLTSVPCERMTHPVFDLQHAELYDLLQPVSLRRRMLHTFADGRVILQRTRDSRFDFESAFPTPGRVP